MGNYLSSYIYKNKQFPSCDYCNAEVNTMTSVVKVFSFGKLDGLFLCDYCLIDKEYRHSSSKNPLPFNKKSGYRKFW